MTAPRHIVDVLHQRAREHPNRPALITRDATLTWKTYADRARAFALGLAALGHQRGQPVSIAGPNRPEWLISAVGSLAAGGVEVGVYANNTAEQMAYVVGHSESFACVTIGEDQLQKLRAQRANLPALRWAITSGKTDHPGEISFDEVLARGATAAEQTYRERVDSIEPGHLAVLVYTSGTTGPPKGAMLSHDNVFWTSRMMSDTAKRFYTVTGDERLFSYLPLAHIAEQLNSIFNPIQEGLQLYMNRTLETLRDDLAWARPTVFFGVPRVWEKMKEGIEAKVREANPRRRKLFARALAVGTQRARALQDGRPVALGAAIQCWIFDRLVYTKLRARLGLDQARLVVSGAAPIGRDVLDFFWALGLPIMEIYGQTEVTGPTSFNMPDGARVGTVGKALPGVEVRLAEDGEILVRGKNRFLGYYKDPAATSAAIDPDGWLRSGDVGAFDPDGFLKITDRKKDLIITAGGKNVAPQNIEALLKSLPLVSQAVVIGDKRPYLVALLALDPLAAQPWAEARGKPADLATLAGDQDLRRELEAALEGVNAALARYETIKKFAVVPGEFTVEGGELTPTMKVKRRVVNERYGKVIESLYG